MRSQSNYVPQEQANYENGIGNDLLERETS
jgi:hypothetical protein